LLGFILDNLNISYQDGPGDLFPVNDRGGFDRALFLSLRQDNLAIILTGALSYIFHNVHAFSVGN
jgi:hypothetical protein